jgi:hypothetical protein
MFHGKKKLRNTGDKIIGKYSPPDETEEEAGRGRRVPDVQEIGGGIQTDGESDQKEDPGWRDGARKPSSDQGKEQGAGQKTGINAETPGADRHGLSQDVETPLGNLVACGRETGVDQGAQNGEAVFHQRGEKEGGYPKDRSNDSPEIHPPENGGNMCLIHDLAVLITGNGKPHHSQVGKRMQLSPPDQGGSTFRGETFSALCLRKRATHLAFDTSVCKVYK